MKMENLVAVYFIRSQVHTEKGTFAQSGSVETPTIKSNADYDKLANDWSQEVKEKFGYSGQSIVIMSVSRLD